MADALDLAMRAAAHPICWAILANGVDDLFIDITYYVAGLFREERRRISVKDLESVPPKRIAIMVPTWREASVIQDMLEHNLEHLAYARDRYDIFVGTYRNDTDTQARVDAVERNNPNVHKVVTPHDGPTNKADNLNWIYQGIQLVEERRGQRFDILLMHDAEDLIHPLALMLYNYLIPRYDFVQTPVFPLERPIHKLVGATYMDEFTEHHLKDMLVREYIGGLVPSAGVGSAFARDGFEEIAFQHSQKAFNTASVTEDYEIGTKFCLAGKKVFFASQAIATPRQVERGLFRKRKVRVIDDEYIATREFFPDTFWGSVRQRSRWVLGIALQGWEQIGWTGKLPVLYCLWRDRKALFTNYVTILAYLLALYCVVRLIIGACTGHPWTFDHIFAPGSWLWWLVMVNTVILGWRVFMKFATVDRIYGALHGVLSVPRFLVANVINFCATSRALFLYARHRWTGDPVVWDKTEHAFPSAEALRAYKRRLGELLLERHEITEDQLVEALQMQSHTGLKLGNVVTITGMATLEEVSDALGDQLEMQVARLDAFDIPLALLRTLPEGDAERLEVLPLSTDLDGTVHLAISGPPDGSTREELEGIFRARIAFEFAADHVLPAVRRRAYRRLLSEVDVGGMPRRLGDALVDAGLVASQQLQVLMWEQALTGEHLGELLVRKGVVSAAALAPFMGAQLRAPYRSLDPAEGSAEALRMIGYGLCSLHGVVPLRPPKGTGIPLLAAASPLHADVRDKVTSRLGLDVLPVLAPSLDVRLCLAILARQAWPDGFHEGTRGLDGLELAAIDDYPGWQGDLATLRGDARRAGLSPIEFLVDTRSISRGMGARLRAKSLGIDLAGPARIDEEEARGWLPPGWAQERDIQLIDIAPGSLMVAAPRPMPRLTRELVSFFPDAAVCWRVAPRRAS